MIKAVLFDLDNTLLDLVKVKTKCLKESVKAMRRAGLKMKADTAVKKLFNILKKTHFENDTLFQEFLREIKKPDDYKLLSAAIIAYRKTRFNYSIPYKNVPNTLKKLRRKGLKLGVITDAPKLKAWLRLTQLGLVNCFDVIIAFDDTKRRKPSTLPFRKAIKELKFKPGEILFVGDNPYRDIRGAKKVGMIAALAEYGQFIKSRIKPDYVLKDVKDLLKIIN